MQGPTGSTLLLQCRNHSPRASPHLVHPRLLVVRACLGLQVRGRHQQMPLRQLVMQQRCHKALRSRLAVYGLKAVACVQGVATRQQQQQSCTTQ